MAGIEDLKKQMSQIADDEYYAGLQSLFERDPAAKEYFDTSAITYPFMEKSGEYNYKGSYARDDDVEKLKKTFEKRKFPISSESSFNEKLEKGEKPIMIYQEPVSTGSEPKDLEKISTILHEMRHKTLDTPEFQDFLMERGLKEETFVRYLDQEFFPELDAHLPNFVNPEKADKIYKEAVDDYIEMFASSTEKGFLAKLKNMFAKGGLATIFTRRR
tara:strand:+ start:42 stop:689 length:648 start_codon:yes stop_codon:yes gene_type:complete